MLNDTKLCIFLKTVIKLCYMNWHLVKLYAMKIKCKTFVIPLSIFQNVFTVTGLHNKLLKPLAQGASRFEKLLARKKVTGPKKLLA